MPRGLYRWRGEACHRLRLLFLTVFEDPQVRHRFMFRYSEPNIPQRLNDSPTMHRRDSFFPVEITYYDSVLVTSNKAGKVIEMVTWNLIAQGGDSKFLDSFCCDAGLMGRLP